MKKEDMAPSDLVFLDQSSLEKNDMAASNELNSEPLSNIPDETPNSSDNSDDEQPNSTYPNVLPNPELVGKKELNPPISLNLKTKHRDTSQPRLRIGHRAPDAAVQNGVSEEASSSKVPSASCLVVGSANEMRIPSSHRATKTRGKRTDMDAVATNSPRKKLKTSDSPLGEESKSVAHLQPRSDEQANGEIVGSLHASSSVKKIMIDTAISVAFKFCTKTDRKSSFLRLRTRRPRRICLHSYSVLKPNFEARFLPKKGTYFRSIVFHKIIARLRYCGLVLSDSGKSLKEPAKSYMLPSPVLWDTENLVKVLSDSVPKLHQDVFKDSLLRNPHYEPYTGQDLIQELGEKNHVQFLQISENTPAVLIKFWNRKRRKTEHHNQSNGVKYTVGKVCKSFKNLDLYFGQDYRGNPIYRALRETFALYSRRGLGLVKQYWVLVRRPVIVSELVLNGWTPKIISAHHQLAWKMVFWDQVKGCLHLATAVSKQTSLAEYVDSSNGRFQPYNGQDLESKERMALDAWHNILKWGPGCRFDDMIFVLGGVDAAKREMSGHERKTIRRDRSAAAKRKMTRSEKLARRREIDRKRRERKKQEQTGEAELATNIPAQEDLSDRVENRDPDMLPMPENQNEIAAKRLVSSEQSDDDKYEVAPEIEENDEYSISVSRATEPKIFDQNRTVLVRHKQLQIVLPPNQSPQMNNLFKFLELNNEYEVFDRDRHPMVIDESGQYLMAKLLAKRQANNIQAVVSALLLKTTQGDGLEKMRGLVEEELTFWGDFENLLKTMADGESVTIALKLLKLLEDLDVFDFFTIVEGENNSGSHNLSSIRRNVESGELCLAHDVMSAFRSICGSQIHYHSRDKVLHEAAVTMFAKGEQTFAYFCEQHHAVMKRDRHLHRIRDIANRTEAQMEALNTDPVNTNIVTSNIVQS